jgi:hypothetical protein
MKIHAYTFVMGAEDIFYSQLYKKSCQIKAALQEAKQKLEHLKCFPTTAEE